MPRGPIYQDDYKPQLSGHETFPLRYGWLKKAYDSVYTSEGEPDNKSIFLDDDSIARFGVGKNMVASMRHWATATGIIKEGETSNALVTTALGKLLFSPEGLDPYMEHPTSLWLIHWQLSGRPEKTTWFWGFNNFPGATFERDRFVKGLEKLPKTELGFALLQRPSGVMSSVLCAPTLLGKLSVKLLPKIRSNPPLPNLA